jgi:hypothetical protein
MTAPRNFWLEAARMHARRIAREQGDVTIDDVRRVCPPPDGCDPRIMGSVFLRKDFQRVDFRASSRQACHGRPIGVFRLKGNGVQAIPGAGKN